MATAPISLYLDIEPGQVADIEVVARTALAFSAAIKEAAYLIDPSLEVRVEFASGTPGSLSLNSIIKSVRKAKDEPVTLGALAVLVVLWFGGQVAGWTFNELMDHLKAAADPDGEPFSPAQLEQLRSIVSAAEAKRLAAPQVQQVYREVERDQVIRGVGATPVPGARPAVIIPRSEFPERAGLVVSETETTVTHRTVPERLTVVLVSPVLDPESDRRWRFKASWGEFGAPVKDKDFREKVLTGTTPVPMMAGIEMEIALETVETNEDGVWVPQHRTVTHVYKLRHPPRQGALPFSQREDGQADDYSDE